MMLWDELQLEQLHDLLMQREKLLPQVRRLQRVEEEIAAELNRVLDRIRDLEADAEQRQEMPHVNAS